MTRESGTPYSRRAALDGPRCKVVAWLRQIPTPNPTTAAMFRYDRRGPTRDRSRAIRAGRPHHCLQYARGQRGAPSPLHAVRCRAPWAHCESPAPTLPRRLRSRSTPNVRPALVSRAPRHQASDSLGGSLAVRARPFGLVENARCGRRVPPALPTFSRATASDGPLHRLRSTEGGREGGRGPLVADARNRSPSGNASTTGRRDPQHGHGTATTVAARGRLQVARTGRSRDTNMDGLWTLHDAFNSRALLRKQ